MTQDIMIPHYNPNDWQKPYEFIPERFDPESEYYKRPADDKDASGSKSRVFMSIPFSYGERKCPGQTFALLEIKVAITYILTHFEFKIDEQFLMKEGVGFAIGTEEDLNVEVV